MFSLERWKRKQQFRKTARGMIAARRAGRGLYVAEWDWSPQAPEAMSLAPLAEEIIAWCRQTLGRCRRPYGIDHFDLALAYSLHDGQGVTSVELHDLRPADLYAPEGLSLRLAAFLPADALHQSASTAMIRVVAGLFSWGDAAHAALPSAS